MSTMHPIRLGGYQFRFFRFVAECSNFFLARPDSASTKSTTLPSDDPTIDENTRLKNRIAELESLVRELRGKPHPRWAESNFRDGDPNEKWHSRASKCPPLTSLKQRRGQSPERPGDRYSNRSVPSLLSPIKTEPTTEPSPHLYRFSPSPAPSVRYHTFQTEVRSPSTSSFDNDIPQAYGGSSAVPFHSPSSPTVPYHGGGTNAGSVPSSYSDGGSYTLSGSDDGNGYPADQYPVNGSPSQNFCPCRTSPGTGVAYISLAQQLQASLNSLRQYSHHPPNTTCLLYRRIVELNNLMHGGEATDTGGPTFENNVPEREIMTPLSASSGHNSFHTGSSGGVSPQEWNTLAAAGYNPYFPVHNDQGIYTHVIT
ncbi:hypothetical protein Hypma_016431 [Hypsizygus marmoreus]|uniref:Uncharacterized protein n=1 Tax=Hypsizygus marmoreus TaxID=39966 RepID=A0A369IY96_HYPMA|nr:hypothetical protein Hypma_016431 [Hypsizygus marmoreus]